MAFPDYVPDGLAKGPAPMEGFVEIICLCGATVWAPAGPDFWHPASGGEIEAKHPVPCRSCWNLITHVTPDMLAPEA